MKNEANVTEPKETNKAPVTEPKETEIYELPDKEFKMIVLRKLVESTDRQLNETRKTMHEQNDKFNKEGREHKKRIRWKFWI